MTDPRKESTDSLIRQLEQIQENTLLPLERRLMQTALWFHKNKDRISDPLRKIEFMEKTLDITLELMALTVQRMQEVEGRGGKSANLWLPAGMNVSGDVKRYG